MRRTLPIAVLLVTLLAAAPAAQAQSTCPWMTGSKTPEQRADELIKAMSLDQKLHQVTYSNPPWFTHYGTAGHIDGTPALCIPELVLSDAGSGVAGFQQGTTVFPSGVGQAAMWNPELERKFGEALGDEAWNKGINVMLGPGINIARIATNGRNFEYMGEDPFLTGRTVAAAVRGIQTKNVLAQVKHYAANNQETERMSVDARVEERTLREIYLPGFERAVEEGGAASVMCAYNKLNGLYACENPELLDGYLRRDWGFTGFVTSDWGAQHSTVESARAGLDMEMNVAGTQFYGDPLRQAIAEGKVTVARLDEMLRHMFVPMFRHGLFDKPPVTQPLAYVDQASTDEHKALARRMSEEGTVLLSNQGTLPLDRGSGRTIGVIGYAANPVGSASNSGGGGSSHGSGVPPPVSPLEGIQKQAAAHGDTVLYADGSSQADATAVATASDVVIVVAADTASEGADRPDLNMHPGVCATLLCTSVQLDQEAMIAAAAAANEKTVVVIDAGAPVAMPWLDSVSAVVDSFFAGNENGNAIAAILYGEANPSGKLPQTFPKRLEDMPAHTPQQYPGVDGKAVYSENLEVGYRWFDAHDIEPLFPFGFGLSYTTFSYDGLQVTPTGATSARVQFTVTNTGKRSGAEVAQLYVGFPKSDGEPPRQLKGFEKVPLEDGHGKTVTIDLDARSFQHWHAGGWVATPGCYAIAVGGSSRDLPLTGVVPIAGGSCGGATTRRCSSRRSVTVHLRGVRGKRIRRVSVFVNGSHTQSRRGGGRRMTLRFSGRRKGIVRVRIVIRLRSGRTLVDRRTYHLCAKRG